MLSKAVAAFIARHSGQELTAIVPRTAQWLMKRRLQGDVCLNLKDCCTKPWLDEIDAEAAPTLTDWLKALREHPCVGENEQAHQPLILSTDQLYLQRDYLAEQRIAQAILMRLQSPPVIDASQLIAGLGDLFVDDYGDEQCQAVALALTQLFAVISGGPGTGKTTSLLRMLKLLHRLQPNLRIQLAAPTGKAAARMTQALEHRDDGEKITAVTLHRLLGFNGRDFKYHANHPLPIDCLIVDEASMIDLTMMDQLLAALPTHARLILIGDHQQLPPVEAGSVLADISGTDRQTISHELHSFEDFRLCFTEQPINRNRGPLIASATAFLHTQHRFDAAGGIATLAQAIQQGQPQPVEHLFSDMHHDIVWDSLSTAQQIAEQMAEEYSRCYQHNTPQAVWHALENIRLLTPVHEGLGGTQQLNTWIAESLRKKQCLRGQVHGTLLMVTRNHPTLQLANGDIGLIWQQSWNDPAMAWFRAADGSMRSIPLPMLPSWQAAWAMTVHKAQGSEYARVKLLLPRAYAEPLLNRQLLYTAVTRARQHFTLYAEAEVLSQTIHRYAQRTTGLAEKLGW